MANIDKIATKKALNELSKLILSNLDKIRLDIKDLQNAKVDIDIDDVLDPNSTNPVENGVIVRALENIANTIDTEVVNTITDINPLLRPDALVLHFITDATVSLSKYSVYEYSLDGSTWQNCTSSLTVSKGSYMYIRVRSTSSNGVVGTISVTGSFNVGGNIDALRSSPYRRKNTYQCFKNTFLNNTGLISAKYLRLPQFTTLESNTSESHYSMFEGCTHLVEAPELPSLIIDIRGYQRMFYGCTSLTKAPELTATVLNNYCYLAMFSGCTSLVEAPSELPATDISTYYYCYESMFENCKSLIKSPKILATSTNTGLSQMRYMFRGCSNLRYIECLINSLVTTGIQDWVNGVPDRGVFIKSSVVTYPTGASGIPSGWEVVDYVSTDPNLNDLAVVNGRIDRLPYMGGVDINAVLEYLGYDPLYKYTYLTIEAIEDTNITWAGATISGTTNTYKYSVDKGVTWNTWSGSISLLAGDKLMLSSVSNQSGKVHTVSTGIQSTGKINVSGNLWSLVYGDDFLNITGDISGSIYSTFKNSINLVSAKNLVLDFGTNSSDIHNTFQGCTSLIEAPTFTALTIDNNAYSSMFYGCTSLAKAPELPALTIGASSYLSMFEGCTSLVNGPSELPATDILRNSYQRMFYGCTRLTKVPKLYMSNINGALACQYMFTNCSSIDWQSDQPVFDITVSSNINSVFDQMFFGCTNLSSSGLKGTIKLANQGTLFGLYNFRYMFYNCTRLTDCSGLTIAAPYNSGGVGKFGQGACQGMFYNCTELTLPPKFGQLTTSGNLLYKQGLESYATDSFKQMFYGCGNLESPVLGDYYVGDYVNGHPCYTSMYQNCTALEDVSGITLHDAPGGEWASMFEGCTSLTKSPTLDFVTQSTSGWWNRNANVCNRMFYGCSSLNSITCLLPKYLTMDMSSGNFQNWVYGVPNVGTFTRYDANADFWSTGVNGIPSGWTIVNAN